MKIALTYTGSEEKHSNYVSWLKAGENIDIIKVSAQDNNLHEIASCDGIVFSGGIDIQPKYYNSTIIDYPNGPKAFEEKRDVFEIDAFQLAEQNNLPILAICRGLQLINCILNGTLQQDLGQGLNEIHRGGMGNDKAHGVNIQSNTILNEITGVSRSVVNSSHHQSVGNLGKGLKINCTADDGTIEGLEWDDPYNKAFLLCIQWHPERMFKLQLENSLLSRNIRDKFIEAVKLEKSKEKKLAGS